MGVSMQSHSDLLRTTLPDLPRGKKMPLSKKGKSIKRAMMKHYGKVRGKSVFYASENKGTIKGVKKRG